MTSRMILSYIAMIILLIITISPKYFADIYTKSIGSARDREFVQSLIKKKKKQKRICMVLAYISISLGFLLQIINNSIYQIKFIASPLLLFVICLIPAALALYYHLVKKNLQDIYFGGQDM